MKTVKLSEVSVGKIFKVGDFEFIKFAEKDGLASVVAKNEVFRSCFGKNNNFAESEVMERLTNEILPKLEESVGAENICEFETDLITFDGLKTYGKITSKISLPTLDFYRANVEIFDKYKLSRWWWLATADSAYPHWEGCLWGLCVSPVGNMNSYYYYLNFGVRPFLSFKSSIFVSCEE